MPSAREPGYFTPGTYEVRKYASEADRLADTPYEVVSIRNAYCNAGCVVALNLLAGLGGTAYSSANAAIGVGDATTATTATMTDLQATTNKLRKTMDASYPSLSGQTLTWQATFGSSDANFVWNEIALFNDAAAGAMLSRIQQNLGTKAAGTSWTIKYTVTFP